MENVVILGSGIAGLTAAIYTARANLNPIIVGGNDEGGQLVLTTEVENFPGFPLGILGPELIAKCREQAERFGAKFISGHAESFAKNHDGTFEIGLADSKILARSVIIATGASAKWLEIPSELPYKGRGVSSCATCDAFFYKNKEVIVVGGGDSACEDALVLAKFATKVTMVHRRNEFRASKIMQDRVLNHEKISILWNKKVLEVIGDSKVVTGVVLEDLQTNEHTQIKCDGVFVAIGHIPNTDFLKGVVELDSHGFLKADARGRTSISGVYAAGDVADPIYKQAITAAGSGCRAALEAEKYLEGRGNHD